MGKGYNGHRSWPAWNVSLWINNDESLYNMARRYARICATRTEAARRMLADLADMGIERTPDGARYTATTIRAAMVGIL